MPSDNELSPDDYSTLSVKVIHHDIWKAITDLHTLLQREYGCDFAYSILAQGHIIGASNMKDGHIVPRLTTKQENIRRG